VAATKLEGTPEAFPGELGITASEQGTTTTISVRGEWDLAQKPAMRRVINDVLARVPECVVLDLARVSFIDSTGVHAVIELHKRAEQQGARVVIVPGPRAVQRIFELVGLTEVLAFLPGQDRTFGDRTETRSGAGEDR
jgi:anti-anti-sigma factor